MAHVASEKSVATSADPPVIGDVAVAVDELASVAALPKAVCHEENFAAAKKAEVRNAVWDKLEAEDVVWFPRPCHGRVPNFFGSADACWHLMQLPELQRASVVKVHPSIGATALRTALVRAGKVVLVPPYPGQSFLYMRLEVGYVKNPADLLRIGDKRIYPRWGQPLGLTDLPSIDVCVVAAVAVESANGRRLGKGKGYGELEYGILRELGAVSEETLVCTTCHDLQVLDDETCFPPFQEHDLPVDVIATPTRLLRVPFQSRALKPRGVFWDRVSAEMEVDIGALRCLRQMHATDLAEVRRRHVSGEMRVTSDVEIAESWADAVHDAWEHSSREEWHGWGSSETWPRRGAGRHRGGGEIYERRGHGRSGGNVDGRQATRRLDSVTARKP